MSNCDQVSRVRALPEAWRVRGARMSNPTVPVVRGFGLVTPQASLAYRLACMRWTTSSPSLIPGVRRPSCWLMEKFYACLQRHFPSRFRDTARVAPKLFGCEGGREGREEGEGVFLSARCFDALRVQERSGRMTVKKRNYCRQRLCMTSFHITIRITKSSAHPSL